MAVNRFPRYIDGIKCECGGYAERVKTIPEERIEDGCGREAILGRECCARAFVCCICGERIVGTADAPKMG